MHRYFYILAGLAFFVYIVLRAFTVGITFDEAWTIRDFVPQKWWDIITYKSADANNHLLNTVLIKAVHLAKGKSLFAERLPNVLAGVVYIMFAYRISVTFFSKTRGYLLFILLLINPFLLDFFSLARGYGLALAFELIAIYYLLQFAKQKDQRLAAISIVMAGLSVLANFAFLFFFIALFLTVHTTYFLLVRDGKTTGFLGKTTGIFFLLAFIVCLPLKRLIDHNMLYYGGNQGLYSDTFLSLASHTMYNSCENAYAYLVIFLVLIVIIISLAAASLKGKKAKDLVFLAIPCVLLLLPAVGIAVQGYGMGMLFPLDRAALYFYPLVVIVLAFAGDFISTTSGKATATTIIGIITASLIINFILTANFYKTSLWYFDAHSKKIADVLKSFAEENNRTIHISSSWPLKNSLGYYLKDATSIQYHQELLGNVDSDTDYYVYLDRPLYITDYSPSGEAIYKMPKDTVLSFPKEGVYLFSNFNQ